MSARHYIAALALAAGGAAIGAFAVPREGELAMIYYRSGRLAEARALLEKHVADGRLTPDNVYHASETYRRLGDIERVIELVERYADAHPGDLVARRRLGDLYRQSGKMALYTRNLEKLEEIAPAPAQRTELLGLYHSAGNRAAWSAMLERLVAENGASAEDHWALARLQAARGHSDRALDTLELLAERHPARSIGEAELLRVSLELDAGRTERARRVAEETLRRRADVTTVLALATLFLQRQQRSLALAVLEPFEDRAAGQPELLRALVALEISEGKAERALARLEAMERARGLAGGELDLLISAALAAGNWDAAKSTFVRLDLAALSQEAIARMAREAAARGDRATVRLIAERLTEDFRNAFPVTAAELAFQLGETETARRWADEAIRRTQLSPSEQVALALLCLRLDQKDRARSLLAAVTGATPLSEQHAFDLAILFARLDLVSDGVAFFDARTKARPTPRWHAARTVLAAVQRPPARDWDLAWADTTELGDKPAPVFALDAAYFAALEVKAYPLAAALALRSINAAPTVEARLRYARALALAGEATTALAVLRPLLESNSAARSIYSLALVAAAKAGTAEGEAVRRHLDRQLRDPNLAQDEKTSLIHDLIAAKAHAVLLPALEAIMREGHGRYFDLYVEALASIRDRSLLRAALERELAQTASEQKLRALARVAFQESQLDIARTAYARLQKNRPSDPEALKRLGQLAAWSGANDVARRYLELFIAGGGDDYEIDFLLGETVIKFADWQRATPHYQRALGKLEKLPKPTLADQMLHAKILYRLARFDQAIKAYDALLRQNPNDRALRDEFADVLTEMGQYERAGAVRAGRERRS